MVEDLDFDTFFASVWPRVWRTTYAVTGDRQLAEDAVQTAFTKAFASWRRVTRAEDPVAYVRRMAINEALNQRRTGWSRRECAVYDLPDRTTQPAQDNLADQDELWLAVLQLPPRQRAVVVLRYYDDLSEAQIAEVLRCRPGTVKSQASAALARLRDLMGETTPTHKPLDGGGRG